MVSRPLTQKASASSYAQDRTSAPWPVLVRAAEPECEELFNTLFQRYPHAEWATFARFGWRVTSDGLVLALADLDPPQAGELDRDVDHVSFAEGYSLRTALYLERQSLAVGVIHSHPEGFYTEPSVVDDDMDTYYSDYFEHFAPGRPYLSLIFARRADAVLSATGRVWWEQQWHRVTRFAFEGRDIAVGGYSFKRVLPIEQKRRVARVASAFGEEATERLARATVAVIGAGGTGSPAIEVLARAGVGHIITVDPDQFEDSNLERVHGSGDADVDAQLPKVLIAHRHIASINPNCKVTAIRGALPQPIVVDALASADVAIGCTDQEHSRLALGDHAIRYLVPAIDVGVAFEGKGGLVTGQIVQLVRFLPRDPCPICQGMIRSWAVAQELMQPEEQVARQEQAALLADSPDHASRYWQDVPILNTVGYLTTIAGALAAGYAIGWITQRFKPPFSRLQLNLSADMLDVTNQHSERRAMCVCDSIRGTADQGREHEFVSAPAHWRAAELLDDQTNAAGISPY